MEFFIFYYKIGDIVSNIRDHARQEKWERAIDKFVMTSAEERQQDKNTTGCISVPLVPAIKVLNSDVLAPRKIAWNGRFVIHSRSAEATISKFRKEGRTITKVVQMNPGNPVTDRLYIWQY